MCRDCLKMESACQLCYVVYIDLGLADAPYFSWGAVDMSVFINNAFLKYFQLLEILGEFMAQTKLMWIICRVLVAVCSRV